jgi:hypothetical protein
MLADIFEWTGSVLALLGAGLLALNCQYSRLAWPLFLLSNFSLFAMAVLIERQGVQLMQLGLTVTSIVGFCCAGLLTRAGWRFEPVNVKQLLLDAKQFLLGLVRALTPFGASFFTIVVEVLSQSWKLKTSLRNFWQRMRSPPSRRKRA